MIEAIKERISTRTFLNQPIDKKDEEKVKIIMKEIEELSGPFGNKIQLSYHELSEKNEETNQKIGTYGFIKNGHTFIAGKCNNQFEALVDFGYLFEILILRLTELKLGTVWLGGTFNRNFFDYMIESSEVVPAITPIGYPSDKKSMCEKIIRRFAKGDSRKPFSEMFYQDDFDHPVSPETEFKDVLTLLQVAPSASNKQPWRILIHDGILSLFLDRTPDYGKSLPYDIQALDMGIACAHLEVGLKDSNFNFKISKDSEIEFKTSFFKVIDFITSKEPL